MLWARHRATESPSWACFPGANPHKIPIDPNGNLASKTEGSDNWAYTWNAENQLTKVEKNSVEVARFSYDPKGRRVEKVAAGIAATYTYDGEDLLREVRGATTLRYVHGSRIDEPLSVDDGTALTYFHTDGLGSIVKVTNGVGGVSLTRQYDIWGRLEVGATEQSYAFTGREWDPEAGLYYYRARYYEPGIGRFLSEDPARWRVSLNFYAYVDGNPVNAVDPLGLQATSCTGCGDRAPQVDDAAKRFCQNVKRKKCRAALEQLGPPGGMVRCAEQKCLTPIPVRCTPNCPFAPNQHGGPCFSFGDADPTKTLFLTDLAFTNRDVPSTFAHEMAHMCGIGNDPEGSEWPPHVANRRAAAMIEKLCSEP